MKHFIKIFALMVISITMYSSHLLNKKEEHRFNSDIPLPSKPGAYGYDYINGHYLYNDHFNGTQGNTKLTVPKKTKKHKTKHFNKH